MGTIFAWGFLVGLLMGLKESADKIVVELRQM